jgi:hypothetical protein
MTAQPAYDNPDDPVEILRLLSGEYHGQFLDEYYRGLDAAQAPEQFRALQQILRLWRLRAVAYCSPGYRDRLEAARSGKAGDFAPTDQVVRSWPAL